MTANEQRNIYSSFVSNDFYHSWSRYTNAIMFHTCLVPSSLVKTISAIYQFLKIY